MNVKEMIRSATLPTDEVPLCLRPDLVAEYEQAERELAAAKAAAGDSLAGPGEEARAIEGRLAELREQMTGSTLTLTLRALPSRKYQALVEKHPPRVDDDKANRRDRTFGFNVDTFFDALARACIVSPELDDEDWSGLFGEDGSLSDGQVETVYSKAWAINKKDVDLPF